VKTGSTYNDAGILAPKAELFSDNVTKNNCHIQLRNRWYYAK